MAKKRIGLCCGGGDVPGLNTVIASIVKALHEDYEIFGFIRSFSGLAEKKYIMLTPEVTSPIRTTGGTILKSTNNDRFGGKVIGGKGAQLEESIVKELRDSYEELGLEWLVVMGGDGTLSTAAQLKDSGFNIIGLPKTIDNDLYATDYTFGFHTALAIVSEALDRLHTTATSHDRVMVCEVMGRHAGWIALYGGIAGGANMILLPEFKFSYQKIVETLDKRAARGRHSTIIVVSEGAQAVDGDAVFKQDGSVSKELIFGGIGEAITSYINKNTDYSARNTALGHIQRGGTPEAYDRIISTQYGAFAAQLIRKSNYGKMVAFQGGDMVAVELEYDKVCKMKDIKADNQMLALAKEMGVSFGQ